MNKEVFYRPVGDFKIKDIPYYAREQKEEYIISIVPYCNLSKDVNFNPKNTSLLFPLYSNEQLFFNGFDNVKIIKYDEFIQQIIELNIEKDDISDCFIELTKDDLKDYYSDSELSSLGATFFTTKRRKDIDRKNKAKEETKRIRKLDKLK